MDSTGVVNRLGQGMKPGYQRHQSVSAERDEAKSHVTKSDATRIGGVRAIAVMASLVLLTGCQSRSSAAEL